MTRVIVLGAGMVGSLIARDLAADPSLTVTSADARADALARLSAADSTIETRRVDLSAPGAVRSAVEGFDLACGALPGHDGFRALREVIDAGVDYCDISFMPEDALTLDDLARRRSVRAVVDCGVAPGMSNLLAGVAAGRLSPCRSIEILVGGLPRLRRAPFEYKAAFSPADVIEEYTRPARYVEHGRVVVREALSEVEPISLPGVDSLEAFNTDGLRSLIHTLHVPDMKEKTLRYPGHAALMRAFREAGFFSADVIETASGVVRPLDVASALLFPRWTYEPGEEDLTVMRVMAEGDDAGRPVRLVWDVLDFYDAALGASSMARTTAFPCALVARELLAGSITTPGVLPPERLATDDALVGRVMDGLESRGVRYTLREETPSASILPL